MLRRPILSARDQAKATQLCRDMLAAAVQRKPMRVSRAPRETEMRCDNRTDSAAMLADCKAEQTALGECFPPSTEASPLWTVATTALRLQCRSRRGWWHRRRSGGDYKTDAVVTPNVASGVDTGTDAASGPKTRIYVSNLGGEGILPSVRVFAIGAVDNATPVRVLEGPKTTLLGPSQMAILGNELYVANGEGRGILVFDVHVPGNVLRRERYRREH